ncbi:MAG: hypothetical protein V4627_19295 [Pseudomonadota bacterium]
MNAVPMNSADPVDVWSLVPIEAEQRDVPHWRVPLPPVPTEAQLLAAPMAQLRDLGALAARDEDPMRLMQGKRSPMEQLSRLLKELVPLIESFRNPVSRRQTWWRRFTGEAMEREVTYLQACQQLEGKARRANDLAVEVQGLRDGLRDEAQGVRRQAQWLGQVVANGQAVLGAPHAAARAQACFADQPDYWSRFARRVENLNALQHALVLSTEQFKLADAHAQAVLDRHSEIVTVLVPLWRQRMGFELFSKSMTPLPE